VSTRLCTYQAEKSSDASYQLYIQLLCCLLRVSSCLLLRTSHPYSLGDQMTDVVTGCFTDSPTWFLILGAVSTVAGIGLLPFNKTGRH